MNTRRLIFWALPFAVSASLACSRENESSASMTPPGISPVSSSIAATPPAQTPPAQQVAPNAAAPAPAEPAQGPSTAEPREPTAQQEEGKRQGKVGAIMDPAKAVLSATDQLSDTDALTLSAAQKSTIESLMGRLDASKQNVGTALRSARSDIADQVRSGSIDRTKVRADESTITRALEDHKMQEAETLNTLHATLDHKARADVVAAARAERKAGVAERQGTAEKQGNWESRRTESAKERQKRQLDRLTSELNLDATQQRQVAALLASQTRPSASEQRAGEQRFDTVLNAFQRDNFDAKASVQSAWPSPGAKVHEFTQRRVAFLEKLLPILHPDQRDKLASKIESPPMERMQGQENEQQPPMGEDSEDSNY